MKYFIVLAAFLITSFAHAQPPGSPVIWGPNKAVVLPASLCFADATCQTTAATNTPSAEFNAGNSGAAITINFSNGSAQKVTLTASSTFTITNGQSGGAYLIRLVQGGAGSFTVTWPLSVKWTGGTAPTLSTAVGAVDVIGLYFDGTNYYGSSGLNFQ